MRRPKIESSFRSRRQKPRNMRRCRWLFFLFATLASCGASSPADTLQLVHVLFRHGDRTPDLVAIYPKDPHVNETYHPLGYGQLTNEGKRREYHMGRLLRKRYRTFLGAYSPTTVDARSTAYNRTKMSLQLVLSSLYPPERDQIWKDGLKWQPIPYNYVEKKSDQLLAFPKSVCPQFKAAYREYLGTDECRKRYRKYRELFNFLTEKTGWLVNSTHWVSELFFTLKIQEEWGLELPSWTEGIYPKILEDGAVEEYAVRTSTIKLKRLSAGFLLKKIIDDTAAKISGETPDKKLFLYSAHEHNIGSMLFALNFPIKKVPPYGSHVIFEVHKIGKEYGFKILYQDYERRKMKAVRIHGCKRAFCPFGHFVKLHSQLLPQSEKECF